MEKSCVLVRLEEFVQKKKDNRMGGENYSKPYIIAILTMESTKTFFDAKSRMELNKRNRAQHTQSLTNVKNYCARLERKTKTNTT